MKLVMRRAGARVLDLPTAAGSSVGFSAAPRMTSMFENTSRSK
jgi:hypothetical protein